MASMRIGGADINTLRAQVQNDQLPDVSSVTYEGLFAEYYFDTLSNIQSNNDNDDDDSKKESNSTDSQLIIPTYCFSKCLVPDCVLEARKLNGIAPTIGNKDNYEYFMNIGLNENFDVNKLQRSNLNLMIVLDNSGSMSSPFNYNDKVNKMKTKMDVANEAVLSLLKHLTKDDRLGVISFNNDFSVVQPFKKIDSINVSQLSANVMNIRAGGGTNMAIAYEAATKMYKEMFLAMKQQKPTSTNDGNENIKKKGNQVKLEKNEGINEASEISETYANRIIFLTDANPNSNEKQKLCSMIANNASRDQFKGFQIHTTFIGVGIDFNTELIEDIIKVEGGNYYSVHSNDEFMKRMDEEFVFMVTPIVFDFSLNLTAEGGNICIDDVFGSGDDDKSIDSENKEVMNVKCMFPSQHDENDQVKGGVVVLKLKNAVNGKNDASYNIEAIAKYKDIDDNDYELENDIRFGSINNKKGETVTKDDDEKKKDTDGSFYDNNGIRKSILLVRYVQLLKLWIQFQEKQQNAKTKMDPKFQDLFKQFKEFFVQEMLVIKDKSLEKEIEILDKLIEFK